MNSRTELSNLNLLISVQQLRAEATFRKVKEILEKKGIDVILLKGPHLGSTIYDSPKARLYGDLDILVRPRNFEAAATMLLENDFQPIAFDQFAPEVQRDFKHWEYRSPWGVTVELHRWLSGHDRFYVDGGGLFERAEPFCFGATPALGLGKEDLLMHLCLHMGTSYFQVIERKHVLDIALLIKKKQIDWPVFLSRAKRSGAMAIAYYALTAARLQEGAEVAEDVLKALRPGFVRRRWLEKYVDVRTFPIYRFPEHSIKEIKKNLLLPLMDKPGQWIKFIRRMVVVKLRMMVRKIKE
jgi:hypothetical protein